MPRARNLKPSFFKDAKVVSCSFEARLLFEGLWCLADYKGRLKYVPLEIKMEIFPADAVDIESCMEELSSVGLIKIYHDRSGAALVQVTNFDRHQNPHVNEKQDRAKNPLPCLPSPEECLSDESRNKEEKPDKKQQVEDAIRVLREYSESDPADSLNLIPDSLLLSPKERKSQECNLPQPKNDCYAFQGENFNINLKDYSKHQEIYPSIAHDLLSHYDQLDVELRGKPKKQIWGALNAKLNYRNNQRSPAPGQARQARLSTVEQASRANAEYYAELERQEAELEAQQSNDQALGVVNARTG